MEKMALGVKLILEAVGEDVNRPGLLDTPSRVARMYRELLYGTGINPASEVTCEFEEGSEDPVIVKGIPFATVCEHHMVPFVGKADVAYIPKDGRITGLSKIARVVELAARRLQVQERMTAEIADAMVEALQPQGVLVILNAEHLCMSIRGIKKPGSMTTTMTTRGLLKEDRNARLEIMQLLER
ncbi:GTP cyclohydrolase I FolE [Candidatus Obscuribacterales bacterium]|nr:GTP cyclohydrolase I FolE [Candidatus Obscuribacterales bacterium]MBX3134709.1 GTP cyclohydrolase I FolE [Candidatus Obscuribacterales bacterium]MBX3150178.1 GTP cyclohydrolase I FolE [Candidatus Obscuribacterales bacterium]